MIKAINQHHNAVSNGAIVAKKRTEDFPSKSRNFVSTSR